MSTAMPESFGRNETAAPWLAHYPSCAPASLEYPRQPVWWLLEEAARKFPQRIACHYYRQELTYEELFREARRAAAMFTRRGVQAGDRVGILLPNIPEYLIAAYGIWMAGGTIVSLNPLMVADDIADLVRETDCRLVVGLDVLSKLVLKGSVTPEHFLQVSIADRLPWWQRLGYRLVCLRRRGLRRRSSSVRIEPFHQVPGSNDEPFEPVRSDPDEVAFILPTGGTTGQAKAVALTHANLVANAWQLLHWTDNRIGEETILAVAPFFHSYGLSTCATTSVAAAATVILHHRFEPNVVLKLIKQYRPTCFPAVPAMLYALNQLLRRQPSKTSLVKYCISGGAPLDRSVAEEFAQHSGAMVVEGYGLSEASPVTHVGPLDGSSRPGTIGLPLPNTEARIVDGETGRRVLRPGEVGELVIRGPQVMPGYWNDPEQTRKVIRDGWLYTGDMAKHDEAGFFRIVDRKKDMIITSGMNVYPAEVEAIIRDFPGVVDVAVIGSADPQRGEIVKAVLVMDKKVRFHRKTFDRFTRQRLAKHKRPRIIEVQRDDLPRNFLGKVLRRHLRSDSTLAPTALPPSSPASHGDPLPANSPTVSEDDS